MPLGERSVESLFVELNQDLVAPQEPGRPRLVIASPDGLPKHSMTSLANGIDRFTAMRPVSIACPTPAIADRGKTLGSDLTNRDS